MTYWLKKKTVLLPKDLNHHLYFKIMILSHTIDYSIILSMMAAERQGFFNQGPNKMYTL
jgi:hypothetical protein